MDSNWIDDILGEDIAAEDANLDTFYCPFTNAAECALVTKGWQPQELCNALECEQLNLFHQNPARKRHRAA